MKSLSIPAAALACVLAGCSAKPNPEQEAVFATVRENLQAMEREDINAVMATVHPETPNFEASKAYNEDLFKNYDLKFELIDLKLVSLKKGEARVAFRQKTHRVDGDTNEPPVFAQGIHTLKKDGGKWKIVSSAAR
jgi:hypothetical protein